MVPLPSCVPPAVPIWQVGTPLCPPHFESPPRAPAYLPWQTLSPPAVPLSWKPASQLQCRVLSTCAQRGARLKAGSSAWRSGAAAGRRRVRAAPLSPGPRERPGARRRAHSAGGGRGTGSHQNPRGRPTLWTAHALHRGQAEGEGGQNRLFVQKGVAHTQCPQPSGHRSSHPLLEGSFVLYSCSFLRFSFCF